MTTDEFDDSDWPTHCKCGAPVQLATAPFPANSDGLDHRCRQCAEHCEIAAYRAAEGVV